jgi:hypothetical protein
MTPKHRRFDGPAKEVGLADALTPEARLLDAYSLSLVECVLLLETDSVTVAVASAIDFILMSG